MTIVARAFLRRISWNLILLYSCEIKGYMELPIVEWRWRQQHVNDVNDRLDLEFV